MINFVKFKTPKGLKNQNYELEIKAANRRIKITFESKNDTMQPNTEEIPSDQIESFLKWCRKNHVRIPENF